MTSCGRGIVDLAEDRREVGLGGEVERAAASAPVRSARRRTWLSRLLGADVEHAPCPRARPRRDLEQQRRLADTGLAAEQDRGARHDAAAEHAVELGDAARPVRRVGSRASSVMGRAARSAAPRPAPRAAPARRASTTVPHCWHSPQRPTHFDARPAALGAAVRGCLGHVSEAIGDRPLGRRRSPGCAPVAADAGCRAGRQALAQISVRTGRRAATVTPCSPSAPS